MSYRLAKLRFRRVFRRRKKQLSEVGEQADQTFERHFIRRLHHLWDVRRFVSLWVLTFLVIIGLIGWQVASLSGYYQHLAPAPGGVWREGVVGSFTDANPIYATNVVDKSVSSLVFAGLFKYNQDNQLIGDLASGYDVSKDGRSYTIHLRPGLTWHDGQPLTAADVAFTYHLIQNPLAQSPLASSWQGVEISAPDSQTVVFKLPNPLASFKHSLTNGIVPRHLLASIPVAQLRSAKFNTVNPVGSGPFEWKDVQVVGDDPSDMQQLVALTAFEGYHSGEPKLGGIIIHAYANQSEAIDDLLGHNIDGLAGLDLLPAKLRDAKSITSYNMPLTAETMVFFKTTSPVLKNIKVRQALVLAANRRDIVGNLPYASRVEREPLLPSQLGYDARYQQPAFDFEKATQVLKKDGWRMGEDGYLYKKKQQLSFSLYALDNPEFRQAANILKKQWRPLGVNVNLNFELPVDFQSTLSSHNYDALLHSISLGVDPDEYVYWDSSQADVRSASRLNLSELKDSQTDLSLEAGRTRSDPKLRAVKYQKFLKAWQKKYPALILYQPHFLYVTSRPLYNFSGKSEVNSAIGRYNNITNWEIRRSKVND